ncbi:MAG: hypothetical protein OWQ48_00765 [Desulfurococcus sp.]|nr:hypothetical protein [Desulfurococcus sp.]
MDLPLAALNRGLFSIIGTLLSLIAIVYLGFGVVELGVLNALNILAYIFVLQLADKLADAGRINLLWRIGGLSMILLHVLIYLSMALSSKTLIYVASVIYAVLIASAGLAINTYIFESRSSWEWNAAFVETSRFRLLFEALLLFAIAYASLRVVISSYIYYVALPATLVYMLSGLVIREPSLKIERIHYRLESIMSKAMVSVDGILALSYMELGGAVPISTRIYMAATVSSGLVFTALTGFRLGSEYLWVPLPFLLMNVLNLSIENVLLIYSAGRLVAFTFYTLIRKDVVFKKSFLTFSIILRVATVLALIRTSSVIVIGLFLGLIYLTSDVIGSNLFLIFAKSRGGYGLGLFNIVSEIVGLVGSITSGYVFASLGPSNTMSLIGALFLLAMPVALRYRSE